MNITFVDGRSSRPKASGSARESTLQLIQQPHTARVRSPASEDDLRPSISRHSSILNLNVHEECQRLQSPVQPLAEEARELHNSAIPPEPPLPVTSLHSALISPAAHGDPLQFVDSFDYGPLSATFSPPQLPTGFTPTLGSGPHYEPSDAFNADDDVELRDPHDIELLSYYRYAIAPRLDLEVGESYFGNRVMHRANHNVALYESLVALSTYQRGVAKPSHYETDMDKSSSSYAHARQCILLADGEDRLAAALLLTMRDIAMCPPRNWQEQFARLQHDIATLLDERMLEGPWQPMSRLALASRLMATSASTIGVDLSFVLQGTSPILPGQSLTHKQQLRQTMASLARALLITSHNSQRSQLPLTATWLSCWSDAQLWFSARNEGMRPIFEVEELNAVQSGKTSSADLPVIIFSNVCALLANFVHHLTALYLLHHKPRLIKAFAETGSSSSPVWHAQRLVGMVAAFDMSEVFDPLVVAGIIYAARRLSHPSQLAVVVKLLQKASQSTGLQLQEEIESLQETLTKSSSWQMR